MQQLYDTVRAAGAENLVIIGGLDWAYDLSGVPANRIDGYNIIYATHPYNTAGRRTYDWDKSWGFLTETDPVIVTEFGDRDDATCATDYDAALIDYADAHAVSWTAWAWYPGGCYFSGVDRRLVGDAVAHGGCRQGGVARLRRSARGAARRSRAGREGRLHLRSSDGGLGAEELGRSGPRQSRRASARRRDAADATPRGRRWRSGPGRARADGGFHGARPVRGRRRRLRRYRGGSAGKTLHANVRLVSGSLPAAALRSTPAVEQRLMSARMRRFSTGPA